MILLPPALRNITKNLFNKILYNRFNRALYNETMPAEVFNGFIAQDKIYLAYYEQALRHAASCAPSDAIKEQLNCFRTDTLQYEMDLFKLYLLPEKRPGFFQSSEKPIPVVKAYGSHLLKQDNYARKIAALAPCFWLYASIGEHIDLELLRSEHPYLPWLQAYADPLFKEAAEQMVALLNECFENAEDESERAVLIPIFFQSLKYEAKFFEDVYTLQSEENLLDSLGVDDNKASLQGIAIPVNTI